MKVAQPVDKESKRTSSDSSTHNSPDRQAQQLGSTQQMLKQEAVVEGIDASPRVTAQRRQIENYRDSARLNENVPVFSITPPAHQQPIQRFKASVVSDDIRMQENIAKDSATQKKQNNPKFNNTGLPNNLKAGIEALSGFSMDNVKVHYNSPKPAELNALAYAQGTEIHLAPGQERHLPHEAWHVVQQEKGKVKADWQGKTEAINSDPVLEHEADRMGDYANKYAVSVQHMERHDSLAPLSSNDGAIQAKLASVEHDTPETAVSAIKKSLKIAQKDMGFNKPPLASATARPKKVTAQIRKKTLRDKERENSTVTGNVTAMARAESLILQGVDLTGYYDGGHLIADVLVGSESDSNEYWNVAPQGKEFNENIYRNTMENEIKNYVKKTDTPVDVNVELTYPTDDPYTVTPQQLIKRGILKKEQVSVFDLNKNISIARRVPNTWKIKAKSTDSLNDPFPLPHSPVSLPATNPTFGQVHNYNVGYKSDSKRKLEAKQWAPGGQLSVLDVTSIITKNFPDFGNAEYITDMLNGKNIEFLNQIFQKIVASYQDITKNLQSVPIYDISFSVQDITEKYTKKYTDFIQLVGGSVSFEDKVFNLLNAQSTIKDFENEVSGLRVKQTEKYPFGNLSALLIEKEFKQQENLKEEIETNIIPEYNLSNVKDFSGYQEQRSIQIFASSLNQELPAKVGEVIQIAGREFVTVKNIVVQGGIAHIFFDSGVHNKGSFF